MAARIQFQPLQLKNPFLLPLLLWAFFIPPSASQSTPQNIEVFFPTPPPPPPPFPPISPPVQTSTAPSQSSNKTVAKAVAATAASTLVLSGLLFLLFWKFKHRLKKETTNLYADNIGNGDNNNQGLQKNDEFVNFGGIKGVIVDEQGLDVLYWKKLEDQARFNQEILRMFKIDNGGRKSNLDFPVQEIPFLRGKSSGSHGWPVADDIESHIQSSDYPLPVVNPLKSVGNQEMMESQLSLQSPPPPPPPPSPALRLSNSAPAPPLPPPPPLVVGREGPPPPALRLSNAAVLAPAPPPPPPPPPPVMVGRKGQVPPPPLPPKTGGLTSSSRPQTPPPTPAKDMMSSPDNNQVKLKPLHWDKVDAKVGHSMVWHKLENGSFRVDDNLMEALFGTVAIDKKLPRQGASNSQSAKGQTRSGPPSQVFILDTRKSQNTAIVLKSLTVSRGKIIDCLLEGKGLDSDTLEKLTRISPSKEEVQIILEFNGAITRLADSESFLYHILKPVPSAFARFNIMLFKSNYSSEVSYLQKSLQTLEMACKELKTRGLFVKLLEAVLKAGNRMNVGTSRGNAQAFNLNSLLKLSDVKSSDGRTTLLHFVVEEVVRSVGKRCMINRSHSLSGSTGGLSSGTSTENDYIRLGLPIVGGVSSEFYNVKKAAGMDHDALFKSCSGLSGHLAEITKTMEECNGDGGGGFMREMERFLKEAERKIQVLREEEDSIMELVKITNEYYQAGASKDRGGKQFQLFVIVKAFLEMVDKACVDIAIKLQKRRTRGGLPEAGVPMPKSPHRPSAKFPVLPANFISSTSSGSSSSSSDSDESS